MGVFPGKCVWTATKTRDYYCSFWRQGCCQMLQTQMMSRLSWQQNEDKFGNLNLLPSTKKRTENSFELFLFIYGYYMFFLKNRTSVLVNNRFAKYVRAFKEICFSKTTTVMRFSAPPPPKKKLAAQQHRAIFRQEKMVFPPRRVALDLPSPQILYGRQYGRTLKPQPKFLT